MICCVCLSFPNLSEGFLFPLLPPAPSTHLNKNTCSKVKFHKLHSTFPKFRTLWHNWMYLPGSHTRQQCFHVSIPRRSRKKNTISLEQQREYRIKTEENKSVCLYLKNFYFLAQQCLWFCKVLLVNTFHSYFQLRFLKQYINNTNKCKFHHSFTLG